MKKSNFQPNLSHLLQVGAWLVAISVAWGILSAKVEASGEARKELPTIQKQLAALTERLDAESRFNREFRTEMRERLRSLDNRLNNSRVSGGR